MHACASRHAAVVAGHVPAHSPVHPARIISALPNFREWASKLPRLFCTTLVRVCVSCGLHPSFCVVVTAIGAMIQAKVCMHPSSGRMATSLASLHASCCSGTGFVHRFASLRSAEGFAVLPAPQPYRQHASTCAHVLLGLDLPEGGVLVAGRFLCETPSCSE